MTSIPTTNPNFIIKSIRFARTRGRKGSKCYGYRSPNRLEENIKNIKYIKFGFLGGIDVIYDAIAEEKI